MKKFLLGCGVLVALMGIGGAVGAYFFLWKPAKSMVAEFAKLQEIPKLNQQVQKTAAFTPPADLTLTADAVDRFVRAQNTIITQLGARANELAAKYKMMEKGRENYTPTWSELMSAYKDFAGLLLEAKRAQVDALNQHNFSLAEYEWTRQRIYEAAGVPIDMSIERIIREVSEGKRPSEDREPSVVTRAPITVPEGNRALVAPHTKELVDRAALVAFGL